MSARKKHPLEILRESGRPLVSRPSAEAPAGPSAEDPPPRAAGPIDPPRESAPAGTAEESVPAFELRLRPGVVAALLGLWAVLLGAVYLLGYDRGRRARPSADREALALGRRLEEAETAGGEQAASPSAEQAPWGVLVVTYDTWSERRFAELRDMLAERYGIDDLVAWENDGRVEIYAGRFVRRDDPALVALAARLRSIRDWPVGDPSPFRTAQIRRHPGIPPREGGGS